MLRVLLGGIAGVATGYALKKYLDEEECYCPHHEDEDEGSDDTDNTLEEENENNLSD
ncbi:hypothetical protein [Sulfuricurvum sp.]|uniref:hypothetical protein n=1 Tax=Sulfuricurvum sp. TaxID=2025608 RepID=UPI0035620DF8